MPVRPWIRSGNRAMRRINLIARRVNQGFLPNGFSSDELNTFEEFELKTCTVQPASGAELETLGEGYKDRSAYTIFSQTSANPAIEGTTSNPDEVFLGGRYTSDPGWFLVMREAPWQNGHINHHKLLVVRKNDK